LSHSLNVQKATKCWNLTLFHHVLLYCHVVIGIYEVIDMHCWSQCYVGGNSCKCKYCFINKSSHLGHYCKPTFIVGKKISREPHCHEYFSSHLLHAFMHFEKSQKNRNIIYKVGANKSWLTVCLFRCFEIRQNGVYYQCIFLFKIGYARLVDCVKWGYLNVYLQIIAVAFAFLMARQMQKEVES
jgi:hypothetical protein